MGLLGKIKWGEPLTFLGVTKDPSDEQEESARKRGLRG